MQAGPAATSKGKERKGSDAAPPEGGPNQRERRGSGTPGVPNVRRSTNEPKDKDPKDRKGSLGGVGGSQGDEGAEWEVVFSPGLQLISSMPSTLEVSLHDLPDYAP